ncbi:hypothetical protein [Psychrobacter jeotgali]|uniref:hypothetical protein n=1 Tax=Psychrobacter jeotgali TaxID=179010 RepID=UPI00191AACF2|nr:hypothetical protein [Psychrobacter jeotgali]
MFSMTTFKKYFSSKNALIGQPHQAMSDQEQQLLVWAASLSAQTQAQQIQQLEKILTALAAMDLDDEQRLAAIKIVETAANRLIATLHKHYMYEQGGLDTEQLRLMDKVKTLYYLKIAVYDKILQSQCSAHPALRKHQRSSIVKNWRPLSIHKSTPLLLAIAIYSQQINYQKLLVEAASFYQKPPPHLWAALNRLYRLACQFDIAQLNLTRYVVSHPVHTADSIHQLYSQMCLHSLLNVRAMSRSSILLLQRLLPIWSRYISATIEPQTKTRIFVDLQSDRPPSYLTTETTINPYNERHQCLFIELKPLIQYLEQSLNKNKADKSHLAQQSAEYLLIIKVLKLLNYRYIERQHTIAAKPNSKQQAIMITGFHPIHYHVAGEQSFIRLIAAEKLPAEQQPCYETYETQMSSAKLMSEFAVTALDSINNSNDNSTDVSSPFSVLKLSATTHIFPSNQPSTQVPPLSVLKLCLLHRPNNNSKLKWSLGLIRWLSLEHQPIEVEWEILGHTLSACGLGLESYSDSKMSKRKGNSINFKNGHTRRVSFVPAFIVAADDQLKTSPSLIMPTGHFYANDKVVIRIGTEESRLQLKQCLLSTKEFSQYGFVRL